MGSFGVARPRKHACRGSWLLLGRAAGPSQSSLAQFHAADHFPPEQQGYSIGYLLSACINLTEVARTGNWRVLFYFASAVSGFAALLRIVLPESQVFIDRRAAEKESGVTVSSSEKSKIFMKEAWRALKLHWVRAIFAICLMTGFKYVAVPVGSTSPETDALDLPLCSFFSHGSQDVYPSYIQESKGLSAHYATLATIVGNCGAVRV